MVKKAVTSGDVARHANVSQSAVSRAFTAGASVAPATRERILEAADVLGYRPNALARAMISGRSRLIALVSPNFDNYFYASATRILSRQLQERGYSNLLFVAEPGDTDEIVQRIMQYRVEGIVMEAATLSSNQADECANTGVPVVLFNRYNATLQASSVVSDNREGGRLVADFLVKGGHKRIAFIAGDEKTSTSRDRESGFTSELKKHNMTIAARAVGHYTSLGAAEATRQLFSAEGALPDAVFVASDHMAVTVMDVLRDELGLSVPEQVSVVGHDDSEPAALAAYNLTTVTQSIEELAAATVDVLLERIDSDSVTPKSVVVPVSLNVRGSARVPVRVSPLCGLSG